MPSHKPMKTYQKKTRIRMNTSSNSVDAVNALFAENLTKRLKSRKKAKVKLKELPPRTQTQLTDDSLKVEPNNTFDKLLKGKIYNEVKVVCNIVKFNSSNSDSSKHISVSYRSPIMSRRRKKSNVVITEVTGRIKEPEKSSTLDGPVTSMSYRSPIMTRRRKKSNVVITDVPDSVKEPEKSSTLDKPVTSSLLIEKENKQNFSSLSYIKLPKIIEHEVVNNNMGPIFSDTFREQTTVHSSTPYINTRSSKIIADTISPITKSDSSSSSEFVKKSFDHIRKWDESFPALEETPQTKISKNRGRPRKLNSGMKQKDWKLDCQVKVWLEDCLRKPKNLNSPLKNKKRGKIRSPQKKSDANVLQLSGFTPEEQLSSSEYSIECHNSFINCNLDYTRRKQRFSSLKTRRNSTDVLDFRGFSAQEQSSTSEYSSKCLKWFTNCNLEYNRRKQRLPSLKTKHQKYIPANNRKSSISRQSKVAKKRITGTRKSRSTKKKSKSPKTRISSKRQSFVTVRRLPNPVGVKKSQAANSRKSKMKKSLCVDVTNDILSEKEMSYSNSTSFDFSASSSSNKVQIEELKDEEINLPKNRTVDLHDFDRFMQSYYIEEDKKAPSASVISLSDNDTFETEKSEAKPAIKTERNSNFSNNRSLDFIISPRKSNSNVSNQNSRSKIVILSDITLGFNNKPILDLNQSVNYICHDHTYSNTPPRPPSKKSLKQPQCPLLESHIDLSDIIESSTTEEHPTIPKKKPKNSLKLKPGKSYRRSLSLLRRSAILVDVNGVCSEGCVCFKCMFKEKLNLDTSRKSQIVPAKTKSRRTLLEGYARSGLGYVQEQEEDNFVDDLDGSVQNLRNLSLNPRKSIVERERFEVTAKEVVLRRCGQSEVLGFEECFPASALQHCHKIGEGVYGEVFLYRNADGGTSVMKIIPIEGDLIVNGEKQKKFEEILSEIVIAMELSNLRNNKKNSTTCFSEVQKVRCTQGNYPDRLVDLWQLYDETKGSENDDPQMFPSDQMYIVLELANGGNDLESFVFNNAMQAYAMFKQTACALAVAENQLDFEHRDLHWGNVLLTTVDKDKTLRFRLDGKEIEVETSGVEVAIIDFTLSRIEFDGVIIFNDLSLDSDLFVAKGDYQFEIYRLMQKSNGNEWQHFEPYTNILWLHYILDKVTQLRYKNVKSKLHKNYLSTLNKLKEEVLSYNSVTEFVKEKFF